MISKDIKLRDAYSFILFHDKVAIQKANTQELMKQNGVLASNHHSYLTYDYSIEFTENMN
jgi:hypothetical protein